MHFKGQRRITGKDVLGALGIDERHESDISLSMPWNVVSLRKEGVLLDLRRLANGTGESLADVAVTKDTLRSMIQTGRANDQRYGFLDLDDFSSPKISEVLNKIYEAIEALIPLADEA